MGWVMAYGDCLACGMPFGYNPKYVPSMRGQPICPDCMAKANALRKERGQEPHMIHPEAYKPIPEEEVP